MLPSCPSCCTVVKSCSGFQYPGMGGTADDWDTPPHRPRSRARYLRRDSNPSSHGVDGGGSEVGPVVVCGRERDWGKSVVVRAARSPGRVHSPDQPETMKRCAGRLHDVSGSNMWSCSPHDGKAPGALPARSWLLSAAPPPDEVARL